MFLWEVQFSIANGEIAIARGERTHIAGCVYRALCCIGQVLFALSRRYVINEKGALAEAAGFPSTLSCPPGPNHRHLGGNRQVRVQSCPRRSEGARRRASVGGGK